MQTKVCTKCKQEKSLDAFGLRAERLDGHKSNCRECEAAYQREYYARNIEQERKRKREWMCDARQDPDYRERCNGRRRGNLKYQTTQRIYNRRLRQKHFFRWRAKNCGSAEITADDLASLWRKQRGRCALSGRKLSRDAHLDHIIPRSKGGQSEISNLRWLDPWVNVARRNLSDEEFVGLCRQVAEWLGRRIVEADAGEKGR